MISIAFALALAAAPAPATGACTLLDLAACRDAGELVRDPAFQAALKQFVGQRRTGYLTPSGQAYGEAITALGGPAEPARRLRNLYVFTACADAACDDRSALVMQPDGELAAVAILHSDCNGLLRVGECAARAVLSILRRQNDDLSVVDALSDWARRALTDKPIAPGAAVRNLDRVEVVALEGLQPAARAPVALPPVAPHARAQAPAVTPAPPPAVAPPKAAPAKPETATAAAQPAAPPPAAKAEPARESSARVETAEAGPVTSVESVTSVVQPLAPRIGIPLKIYVTLNTDIPPVVIVPPPPPPAPPKPRRHTEMWKWHWTPFD